ncbi:MAG: sugar phosphate isomerase/epimerase [Clostridia bacterium]|nr:sugar phosphate isomerase/epimerase [Clostridia bacterium]
MKIGISSSCLYPMYTEESFRLIAQQGVQLSEIFFNANCELEPPFIKQLCDIKNEYGIEIKSVHPTMSLAESFMLFSNYDRRFNEGIEIFKRYGEIAAQLDAKYVIMHGGKYNGTMDNHGYFDRFARVAEAVKQNGATLLQENVVNFRAGSLEALEDMSNYLGDQVNFCLDVKQSIRGGYSPYDVLHLLGSKIKHLHISDNNDKYDCMLPLDGNFNFKNFLTEAIDCGYTGDAVIEVYRAAFDEPQELFWSHKKLLKNIF